jgi:hypothetical protein
VPPRLIPFLFIGSIIVWPIALIHCMFVKDGSLCRNGSKGQWLLLIFLLGVLGASLFLLVGRPAKLTTV